MAPPIGLLAARAAALAEVPAPTTVEWVALGDAHRRHLASAVVAEQAWPTTDRAAMDGFALVAGDLGVPAGTTLPVVGESLAGVPFPGRLEAGTAIRIMTGAVVPDGADTVVPVEATSGFGGVAVEFRTAVRAGQHIRRRGSELAAGTTVLSPGHRLGAAEIGVLAVLGHTHAAVYRRPVVAILATGDEVVPVDCVPLPHQVRESNSWALAAQVDEAGGEAWRLGVAPDAAEPLQARLAAALAQADVVLTIGGVSKGTHDLVQAALAALGVRTVFHGIDLKPGKPTFCGVAERAGRQRLVFGLPGNPASSFTVFDLLVRPVLASLCGAPAPAPTVRLPVAGAGWLTNARLQAIPARLVDAGGGLAVALVPPSPSGDPFGLLGGTCYALVEGGRQAGDGPVLVAGASRGVDLP